MPPSQSGASASNGVEDEGTALARVNWLRTWLAQSAATPEPAPSQKQVQWLTLLPSVPAFQVQVEEPIEEELEAVTGDAQPVIAAPVAPLVPVPLAPSEPAIAAGSAQPEEQVKVQPRAETPIRLPAKVSQPDKGELIWTAEFVVAEKAPAPTEPIPGERPEKAVTVEAAASESRQQSSEDKSPEHRQGERSATGTTLEPSKREAPRSPGEKFEVVLPAVAPQGNTKVEAGSAGAAAEPIASPAVGGVELDTARPLRPAQIATLYVDVPAPGGGADAAPMRLAVTQRGDQVNVRLRSWDAGAAPLDNERMQPLLQSLAEQGYASAKKSVDRLDELSPLTVEHLRERPILAGEAANSNNDPQSFQNPDDRQRKNQERQQQAFLLRRQMQNLNTEQFDLQAQLEGFSSSQ